MGEKRSWQLLHERLPIKTLDRMAMVMEEDKDKGCAMSVLRPSHCSAFVAKRPRHSSHRYCKSAESRKCGGVIFFGHTSLTRTLFLLLQSSPYHCHCLCSSNCTDCLWLSCPVTRHVISQRSLQNGLQETTRRWGRQRSLPGRSRRRHPAGQTTEDHFFWAVYTGMDLRASTGDVSSRCHAG